MANPFDSLVGLRSITSGERSVWVNDVTGISTELVSAVSNPEDTDTAGVWSRVNRSAYDKLLSIIEGELAKVADFRFVMGQTMPPDAVSNPVSVGAPGLEGAALTIPYENYSAITVNELRLISLTGDDTETTVYVFDLLTGLQLKSQAVTVSYGYNAISLTDILLPNLFGGRDLFVGIDASALSLRQIADRSGRWDGSSSGFDLQYGYLPLTGDRKRVNFTQAEGMIWVDATVRCSLDDVVKKYAKSLAWGYAYLLGSMLMAEKLASPRFNLFTNTNRLYTEELEPKLMDEAKSRIRTVCKTILRELRQTPALQPDSDSQAGYFSGSFV